MAMRKNFENDPIGRFTIWCTIYAFFINMLCCSVPYSSTIVSKNVEAEYSIGGIIDACINLFVSEASAQDIEAETALDFVPIGDSKVSDYAGAFSYSYPIEVPTGRGGLTPKLELTYSSFGKDGWIGVGWDLTESYIERDTKWGMPDYDDNDMFTIRFMGSSMELIESGSEFRVKNERAFLRLLKSGDTWIVTGKDGTKYYFGTNTGTKLDGGSGTFRWYLQRIIDLNGNQITYNYNKDTINNQVYLSQIDYSVDYHVVFVNDSAGRTDSWAVWKNYFEQETIDRLKEIQVYYGTPISSNLVRSYKLSYAYSKTTSRSILTSITQYGKDGSSLPSTKFTVNTVNTDYNGFEAPDWWQNSISINTSSSSFKYKIRLGDFNGDGKMDVLYYSTSSNLMVMLSNGSKFIYPSVWYGAIDVDDYGWDTDFWIADFNGDGKSDVGYMDTDGDYWVLLSNGYNHFIPPSNYWHEAVDRCFNDGYGYNSTSPNQYNHVGDINGDGAADIFFRDAECDYMVMMSNGVDGFNDPDEWWDSYAENDGAYITSIADYNGDGKNDLEIQHVDTTGTYWWLQMWLAYNNGSDFYEAYKVYHFIYSGVMPIMNGDFNGDGKRDYLLQYFSVYADTLPTYVMKLLDCKTEATELPWEEWYDDIEDLDLYGTWGYNYFVVDLNGDGKDDILYRSVDDKYRVMLSKGNSFNDPDTWGDFYDAGGGKIFIADFTGDGMPDIMYIDENTENIMVMKNHTKRDLVTSITDSLGAKTTIEYVPSSEWENDYLPFKIQTVKSVIKTDNVSHTAVKTYTYEDGFYDIEEMEFRGFEKVVATDNETGFVTESHYYQDPVFCGLQSYSETKDSSNKLIVRTNNSWKAIRLENDVQYGSAFTPSSTSTISVAKDHRTFPYLEESIVSKYDNSGSFFASATATNTYDVYGNVLLEHIQTSDGSDKYTRTVYSNDTSAWLLGKPTKVRIDTSDPTTSSTNPALRETQYSYYSSYPWRIQYEKQIHWAADESSYDVYTTTYGYDSYGNLTSEEDPRGYTTTTTYDSNGMFPIETTNALDQTIARTFDPSFGKVLTETDPNGSITTYSYDDFGRKEYVSYNDGSYEDYTYHIAANNHYVKIVSPDKPTVTTYYDNFGRKTTEKKVATDGTTIYTETQYDDAGRVYRESLPSFDSGREWTTFEYDGVRQYLDTQTNPDGTDKTFTKNGFVETTTDENEHKKSVTKDALDRIVKVEEALGSTAEYEYDIFDNLLYVYDPLGNKTSIEYDDLGRKILMDDPYMSVWEYEYDENSNLVLQVDGNADQTVMEYDELNRIEEKYYITDGTQVSYVYDEERTDYYNIGSLTTVEFGDMVTEYNYDDMGRTVNESRTIVGANSGNPYIIDRDFDQAGRLESIQYPDNARTQYDYFYNPIGTLSSVETDGTPLAEFFEYNALGQVGSVINKNLSGTYYVYKDDGSYRLDALTTVDGDNVDIQFFEYEFDDVGNITGITDNVSDTTQSFAYDNIDRLITASASSQDPVREYDQSYAYDLAGNMIERTGIGPFKVWDWEDSTKHIRPALINYKTEITGLADRTVHYYQNDKPSQISYDGTTTTDLYYDGEGNRVKKVQGGQSVVYVGNIYEERGGESLSYIYANGKKFVTISDSHEYYTHTDHLGSTSLTTDETGQVIEEIGYLPFGAELFRATYNNGIWESSYKFTGQEFDKEYQFYNYKARLYDPVMGRFITPDSIVPDWYDPQSLNRYAYTRNNPLKYIDPTGHEFEIDWGQVVQDLTNYTQGVADEALSQFDSMSSIASSGAPNFLTSWQTPLLSKGLGKYNELVSNVTGKEASTDSISYWTGRGIVFAGALAASAEAEVASGGVKAYQVGEFKVLQKLSTVGDDLALHHVGQSQAMKQIVPDFTRAGGASIALPTAEHIAIPTLKGSYEGSARSLLAKDILNLRSYTNAPNSSLQELIQLNKELFPGSFLK